MTENNNDRYFFFYVTEVKIYSGLLIYFASPKKYFQLFPVSTL